MRTDFTNVKMPSVDEIKKSVISKLKYSLCLEVDSATNADIFNALALTIRDYQLDGFFSTRKLQKKQNPNASIIYLWSSCLANLCVIT